MAGKKNKKKATENPADLDTTMRDGATPFLTLTRRLPWPQRQPPLSSVPEGNRGRTRQIDQEGAEEDVQSYSQLLTP